MAHETQHRKDDEKDEMAYPDETFVDDVAKQPVVQSPSTGNAAMTRRILLKLDIRYILTVIPGVGDADHRSESYRSSHCSSSVHFWTEPMSETPKHTGWKLT